MHTTSHDLNTCICCRAPAQPPLPELVSFKIAQRSTRQLNLNPESPDPKASRPPLPSLPPGAPSALAPATAQPSTQQPLDAPATRLMSDMPQPSAIPPLSDPPSQQQQQAPHIVPEAAAQQAKDPAAAAAPAAVLHLPDIPATSKQHAMPLSAAPHVQTSAAASEIEQSRPSPVDAQLESMSISPDRTAADRHESAAVGFQTSRNPAHGAADQGLVPATRLTQHVQHIGAHTQDARPDAMPASTATGDSSSTSGRSHHPEVPALAVLAHGSATPSDPPHPHDRALQHDRPAVADRGMANDRLMAHDRLASHNRQPTAQQLERSRPQSRFSDHPSGSRSPGGKRSREPEHAPAQDYNKRPRADSLQHTAPAPVAHHRQLDIRKAKREADCLAAVRRQEVRESSHSQSPGSDRVGPVPNGKHAPRFLPSRHSMHSMQHEHSMSMSPSAQHKTGSPTPDLKAAPRFSQRHTASENWQSEADAFANGHRGDPSRYPPARLHDPNLSRNGSWSTVWHHSNPDVSAPRKYSNYGRHPKLSGVDTNHSLEHPCVNGQDSLERRVSSLHSSEADNFYPEHQHSRAYASMHRLELKTDRAGSDRSNRRRSSGNDRLQDHHAMHRQHSHSVSPSRHQAAARLASNAHNSTQARLQMQQQLEAANQAAAVKLDTDMESLMTKLCQAYGLPASAMGSGAMLKNEQRSGLFDLMSAAVCETEAMNAMVFTVTRTVRTRCWLRCTMQH